MPRILPNPPSETTIRFPSNVPSAARWPSGAYASHAHEGGHAPTRIQQPQQQERFDAFIRELNTERLHEVLDKCPAKCCTAPLCRPPKLSYPFHDRDVTVTACGCLRLSRKKINISVLLAGQKLGIKEARSSAL